MISAEGRSIGHPAFVLACLSLASGCTDVLTFLKLGEVFTSAMTGNTALLGIALSHGKMLAASRSLTALFGFMVGAGLAAVIYNLVQASGPKAGTGLRWLLGLELVCLGGCTALWSVSSNPIEARSLYPIIVLSALSMGIQGLAAQRISSSGISTIVFTSALIRIVTSLTGTLMHLAGAAESRVSMKGHLATFAAYSGGAALTGLLVSRDMGLLIWIPALAVLLALGFSALPSELAQQGA
ncbi:YoaK family protein [Methylovirgula sp. HY1]|uniref:YoaK family protein n=1 Tax=Methylovirgula sp. HY1 TaxID=2822761 RepID=UPI001C5B2083|nr:YoaK family protein [Methylovirgula sp. HY1]QXX74429.1 hypothetical protein MHY1_01241 [Methylovirgula sp. HY1]